MRVFSLVLILIIFFSCDKENFKEKESLFVLTDNDETGVKFINEVKDQNDFNIFTYRNFYNGGGVAIGDINNDGLSDIYFTSNTGTNKLYLNKGNWSFEDITSKAGVAGEKSWSTGVTMADINGDGYLDIYVCNSGDIEGGNKENELFINNRDLTFTEKGKEYNLDDPGYSTHASFFDFDVDGDLDCYVLNNSFKSIDKVDQFLVKRTEHDSRGGDRLMRNDGGKFTEVTLDANIFNSSIGFGLGVSVGDINGDMYPDIYISNDFWERDYLYINNGDGTFSEELIQRTDVISGSSMGADIADLNNDGRPEIFTTEMLPGDNFRLKTMTHFEETNINELKVRSSYHYQLMQNCLHLNKGRGNFQEIAFFSNVAATDWSWGALMFDVDNNGWKDIFISNGIYRDITSMDFGEFIADRENIKKTVLENGKYDFTNLLDKIPSTKISNYIYINHKDLTFRNLADSLGLNEPTFSNGSAYGDLDNDGDLDLVLNNLNMPSYIYKNNAEKYIGNNYLKIAFKGPKGNTFGIGSKVILHHKGTRQVFENYTSRGFQSSVEPVLTVGLGESKIIDSLTVIWPDFKMETIYDIKVNQVITLEYFNATEKFKYQGPEAKTVFTNETEEKLLGNNIHKENEFDDFDYERLLLRKISTEGPKIIKGDVNGDSLEDFVLLSAYGDYDKLFIQSNGKFKEKVLSSFLSDSSFESTCGAFLDSDGDGDLDLVIGSGGNEFDRGINSHFLRFYENDGNGNFENNRVKAPTAIGNFSCIKAEDFDNDGDPDLFIGGRVVPGNYGLVPRSFLFRNDGGAWTDISPRSLSGVGMVTDAEWSDYDGDNLKDLIVVGEWMPITIFKNSGVKLEEAFQVHGTSGWWLTIENADLDQDGNEDFILGNWGLNTKFKASVERPLSMYVKDFDNNKKSEFIINWYPPLEDKAYPFATKMDITQQMPLLKKQNLKHEDYAKKTYETLIPQSARKDAIAYKAEYLESAILWNDKGKISLQALPAEAQITPVFAIEAADFDHDGIVDLLLGGNFYGLMPQVGRHNSSRGIILKGKGGRAFENVETVHSGIEIEGEIRDIKLMQVHGENYFLFGRNNSPLIMYTLDKQELNF